MEKIFLPILVHSDLRNKTSDFENLTSHKLAEIFVVLWSYYYINSAFIKVTKVVF